MRETEYTEIFLDELPAEVFEFLKLLWQKNYTPIFVGGVVRDFILLDDFSTDMDLEVHYATEVSEAERLQNWKNLKTFIAGHHPIEELSYEVLRIKLPHYELELSQPRKEIYPIKEQKSHHDFDCKLFSKLPVTESFKRRDFTFNAMGVAIYNEGSAQFIDPFKGLTDLATKKINSCSEDFVHDPVRFLRAVRFYFKLGFAFSNTLTGQLSTMNLEKVSAYYLWNEGLKSHRFFPFLKKVFELAKHPWPLKEAFTELIKYSDELDDFHGRLQKFYKKNEKAKVPLVAIALHPKLSVAAKQIFCQTLQISFELVKRIDTVRTLLSNWKSGTFQKFRTECQNKTFEELSQVKDWNALLVLRNELNKLAWPLAGDLEQLEVICELLSPSQPIDAKEFFSFAQKLRQKVSLSEDEFKRLKIPTEARAQYLLYLALRVSDGH
ncbi:MAG: CCA tRNA nucleotidyltransferase [Bacteriovoracaceae bacterium]|nr:CCA tRNA nucleotidyltransferase [Bacteriovoracaceae bacterium]